MTLIEIGITVWAAIIFTLGAALIALRLYIAWAEWELKRLQMLAERVAILEAATKQETEE